MKFTRHRSNIRPQPTHLGNSARAQWSLACRTACGLAIAALAALAMLGPLGAKNVHAAQTFDVTTFGADPTGTKDSAKAIQNAINAAQAAGPGNIVYVPTGHYVLLLQVSGPNSLLVIGPAPITLQGDGPTASVISERRGKNILTVQTDGTVINNLGLDTQSTNERSALVVNANNTLLENASIMGGSNTFALYYSGPNSASQFATGNKVQNVTISDQWTLDGFSYSRQQDGLIKDIDHTGSRLALFRDQRVEVDNYRYHPGPQSGGTQGFWITPPSNNITINDFVTDGNGGTLGANASGEYSSAITINREVFNQPGFHLSVGEVRGLTLDGCNFGTNSTLRFFPNVQASQVVVKNCSSLPNVRFVQPASGSVQAEFDNNTYPPFTPVPKEGSQTFLNSFGGPTDFTVNGGTFQNCAGGFFKGSATTFTVNGLSGYPCAADSPPTPALTVTPSSGQPPLNVTADASASTDTDSTPIANYQFNWGDGTLTGRQTAATATHTYTTPGSYTVSVAVTDTGGLSSTATSPVTVDGPIDLIANPGFETGTSGWKAGAGTSLAQSTTAHSGSFSGQLTRRNSSGRATLTDSPPSNSNTVAGTTCSVSVWVQAPAGVVVTLRTTELQGGTTVATHLARVKGADATWVQAKTSAPIVNGGDTLQLSVYGTLAVGQALLVDDASEICQ